VLDSFLFPQDAAEGFPSRRAGIDCAQGPKGQRRHSGRGRGSVPHVARSAAPMTNDSLGVGFCGNIVYHVELTQRWDLGRFEKGNDGIGRHPDREAANSKGRQQRL